MTDSSPNPSRCWVAVAYAALNLTYIPNVEGLTFAIVPVLPSDEPIGISGEVAELWARFVDRPVYECELTQSELELVSEFIQFGILSDELDHICRLNSISVPWMESIHHELVYGLIASYARTVGIPYLFIKGPVLFRQGIRRRSHSGDVDVLVLTDEVSRLSEFLEEWGWTSRPDVWEGSVINHSLTMMGNSWACEVDIHRYIPGSHLSNEDLFTCLNEQRESLVFASVEGFAPSRLVHAVVYALNEVKPSIGQPIPLNRIETAGLALSKHGDDLIYLATRLKVVDSLRPSLSFAFPDIQLEGTGRQPLNWYWKSRSNRVLGYLTALRMLPIMQRPKYFCRIVWPRSDIVESTNIKAGESVKLKSRYRRFLRAISR